MSVAEGSGCVVQVDGDDEDVLVNTVVRASELKELVVLSADDWQ